MDSECKKCGTFYEVREGNEPTPLCDPCAQVLLERVGKALSEQNHRWGLYGNESQEVLKEFHNLYASTEEQK